MADISHYGPAAGEAASSPLYRALCVRSGNVVALGMQKTASVNCAGMALFRVFQGNVAVLGFRPPLGVYFSLHSPKWNSLLVIEGRPGNEETQAPFGPTNSSLLQVMEPNLPAEAVNEDEEIAADKLAMQLVEDFPVVLVLRAIPVTYGNATSFYENTRPEKPSAVLPGFKMIVSKHNQNVLSELTAGFTTQTLNFTEPWQATVDRLQASLAEENPQKIVVCGGKGVGKLGPERAYPVGSCGASCLATPLLGPGFSHMKHPIRSFFCGNTNPGNDPLYYMKAVKSLLRLYEVKWGSQATGSSQTACVPLVINTDGWIKSMGHDLLCNVIQESNPDHVVQLVAATKNKQFDIPTEGRWRIHAVPPWDPVGVTQPPRSSKELRVYRFHSYFLSRVRCDLPRPQLQNLQVLSEKNRVDSDIYRAYAQLTPFAVSFDHVDVAFAGSSVAPSQLLFSLNASVVGLCINPDYKPIDCDESEPGEGPPRIVRGIIRAVDAEKRQLFILSPLPLSVLKRINLLVRSSMPLDNILLSAQEPAQAPYVVTDVVSSDGTGSSVMQSRNNLKRKRDGK
ncbi:Polyribonucleotide 5'-hydroxyl-kinase Clp1, P-loop domain [Phytophthora cactorum]|nr:Polyribonucleotide 5'-hydroxyl-kinase Clp1, P-loop domain [Phytophthora cactorum]